MLLDEPTRGIDVASKSEIYRLIDELAAGDPAAGRAPKAVLIVSSYLPELLGVCDEIAVMTRGRLGPDAPRRPMERAPTDARRDRQRGIGPSMTQVQDSAGRTSSRRISLGSSELVNTLGRFVAILVVYAFFAFMIEDGKFYSPRVLESIVRQSAVYATAGLGMTLIIIAGGIDLSIGSILALTVVVVAWVLNLHVPNAAESATDEARFFIYRWPVLLPLLAVAAGVFAAALAGAINGLLIVGLRLVPFIVTLGTLLVWRALAKGIAQEKAIYPQEDTWVSDIMQSTFVPFLNWARGA